MASKRKDASKEKVVIYARVTPDVRTKLQKLAALRTAKRGETVTMQDTLTELIREAR